MPQQAPTKLTILIKPDPPQPPVPGSKATRPEPKYWIVSEFPGDGHDNPDCTVWFGDSKRGNRQTGKALSWGRINAQKKLRDGFVVLAELADLRPETAPERFITQRGTGQCLSHMACGRGVNVRAIEQYVGPLLRAFLHASDAVPFVNALEQMGAPKSNMAIMRAELAKMFPEGGAPSPVLARTTHSRMAAPGPWGW